MNFVGFIMSRTAKAFDRVNEKSLIGQKTGIMHVHGCSPSPTLLREREREREKERETETEREEERKRERKRNK
jgi:hypothetical protein